MKKLLIFLFISFSLYPAAFSQGEIDEQQKVFFRDEKSLAVSLHTDGFGFGYREGKRIDYLNKRLYEFDFLTIKHPKEHKQTSYYSSSTYVFGKMNSSIYLRGGIGGQHEIFKKADLGGIAVRYFYIGGAALSLYKPIYYKIANVYFVPGFENYYIKITEEKFEGSIHSPEDIFSKAPFSKGLDELKLLPGIYAKTGLNFEYSIEDKSIQAVEIGAQINGFPKKIPIMAGDNNKAIYFSLFVSYRVGIIVDPLSRKKTNFFRIFSGNRVDVEEY